MSSRQSLNPRKQSALPSSSSQPNSQSKGVGYPILKAVEIVDVFRSLDIQIQEDDINKPTAHAIQTAWRSLLEETSGVSIEGFERPKGALLGMMQYPDLLSDAATFQMFFTHVRRLAKVAGVDSFTIQDLTRPEATRVRDAFSGMVNFLKFRHNMLDLPDGLVNRGLDYSRHRSQLEEQARALQHDIANIKNQRAADIPRIEESKERNQRLKTTLMEVHAHQTVLTTELTRLVDERAGLKEQKAIQQTEIHTLEQDINLARSRLVQSPERLRKTISDLSANTNKEKATLANFTKKGNELSSKLEQIVQLETEVRSLIEIQHEAEDAQKLTDQAKSKLSALNYEFDKAVVQQTSSTTRIEQLNTQLANATDKLIRIKESFAEKKEKFSATTAKLRSEYEEITKQRDADDAQLRETEKEVARLTGETEAYIAENQAEANELMSEYWRLREHVEAYMAEMTTKLGLDA